ncbi:MAG: hypothetical protein WKF97_03380 [Chitinophagaceae bacterium]
MKLFITLVAFTAAVFLTAFKSILIEPKDIIGAWEYGTPENKTVMINTENIFSVATYDLPGKKFISAYGGKWRIENNKFIRKIEWNSTDSTQVGKSLVFDYSLVNGDWRHKGQKSTGGEMDECWSKRETLEK